eukprot:TRINITY_DN64923_c0_g1_i1.p1 TRINITY_DN64923_c0_g1~~TRINITY_DN64923_c0_g1_i1.p1  ORF type:complete len:348 (+),score=95.26 TRINITY_DN64923_c0_g1_i1:105-1046(+)
MVEVMNTGHEAAIHDAVFDHFGKYLATCSSDSTVRVFSFKGGQQTSVAELREHRGPVWRLAWAHPRFGCVLASASYDHRAVVWSQQRCSDGMEHFIKMHDFAEHHSSVNCVAFAPPEAGLALATASSDARVAVVTHKGADLWETEWVCDEGCDRAHAIGVQAVAFAPTPPGAPEASALRLASAGADNKLKLWRRHPGTGKWVRERHTPAPESGEYPDWVRDVAFSATSAGLLLACCADDKAWIWCQASPDAAWELLAELPIRQRAWRVAWQDGDTLLAVTGADGKATVFKPADSGARPRDWKPFTVVDGQSLG